jgi:hypothetical protein
MEQYLKKVKDTIDRKNNPKKPRKKKLNELFIIKNMKKKNNKKY